MNEQGKKVFMKTFLAAVITLPLIIAAYLYIDLPVAVAAHNLKETFAIPVGKFISSLAEHHFIQSVSLAALLFGAADALINGFGLRARAALFLGLSICIAMFIGEELKWFFGRCRPPMYFEDGSYGFTWFSGKGLKHSFPSGHTLRAFSTAFALCALLPKYRKAFLAIAVLIGISRVVVGRHYPSDVIFGVFIGYASVIWTHWFLMRENRNTR